MRRENLEREGERGKEKKGATRVIQNERGKGKLQSSQHYHGYLHKMDNSTTSFFVSNFPDFVNRGDLWQIFARFGNVGEVFIPNKVDKWGNRFAFVKFREVRDVEELEGRMQEVKCGEEVLKVNIARFGREEDTRVSDKVMYQGESSNAKVLQGKSYKEALSREGCGKVSPLVQVAVASVPALVVQPSEDMIQFLSKGFVARMHFPMEVSHIQTGLSMEGWREIKVFSMGEGMVLLHSEREGVIQRASEEKKEWWSNHFLKVQNWMPHFIGKQRRTWLKLYGVPLHIWEESVFKKIGGRLGELLDFDGDLLMIG